MQTKTAKIQIAFSVIGNRGAIVLNPAVDTQQELGATSTVQALGNFAPAV